MEVCGATRQNVPQAAKRRHRAGCGRLSSVPPMRWVLLFNPQPGLTFRISFTFGKWIRNESANWVGSSGIREREPACNQRGNDATATREKQTCHTAKTNCQEKEPSKTQSTFCHRALEKLGMQNFGILSSIFSPEHAPSRVSDGSLQTSARHYHKYPQKAIFLPAAVGKA